MLNHLSDGTDDTALLNRCHREVLNRLINRPYTSTPNGAETWFADAEEDRDLIIQLGHTPQPYATIMATALGAFQESDLPLYQTVKQARTRTVTSLLKPAWKRPQQH